MKYDDDDDDDDDDDYQYYAQNGKCSNFQRLWQWQQRIIYASHGGVHPLKRFDTIQRRPSLEALRVLTPCKNSKSYTRDGEHAILSE